MFFLYVKQLPEFDSDSVRFDLAGENNWNDLTESKNLDKDNVNTDVFVKKSSEKPISTEHTPKFKLLMRMIQTLSGIGFIISSVTLTMGTSIVEGLIFLYFETLGASNTILGLTVLVTVMFEIPIFHYAPNLLNHFGAEMLQVVACFAYMIRVVGYTFIPPKQMSLVLLLEPLHGVTYACSKTSSVEFAAKLSWKGYEASAQGLMSLILGIGGILGLTVGGWIEKLYGPVLLYRGYACIVGIGLVIFWIALRCDSSKVTIDVTENDKKKTKSKYNKISFEII